MQATPSTILCAERASGPLSLGLLVGGMRQRLHFQHRHTQFLMLDAGGDDALHVVADHIAAGIDPHKIAVFEPARVPELAELRTRFADLAPAGTVHTTALLAALQPSFVSPQAASAADVTAANQIVRGINARAGVMLLAEAQPLLAQRSPFNAPRVALDVPFSADVDTLARAIDAIPAGATLGLPARETEGHPLFQLLEIFEADIHFQDDLKAKFRRGGLSERVIRAHLGDCAERFLAPLRERRTALLAERNALQRVLADGARVASQAAATALQRLRAAA
ncbi:Tryptophan--tRNA ligase 2 [Andreprevotia sp. IGB-42]|uniref:hypothetical protein n=1 Tax=Andreprevotia sp. IGB-42 TaxID=2497473 RepID=UPI00135AE567|nr:hypothetical protein [Andreprevotia sp. IGB-42]KAF0811785.1 Tryptophan--tRNA ligase 2 [Andreprevotia sp. IGB-42]